MPQSLSFFERKLPRIRPSLSFRWSRIKAATVKTPMPKASAKQMRTTIMNIFPDSYEGWNMFFQIASVILVLLTFAAAAGTVITGRVVNNRQAERILILEKETVEAKRAYLELQERLRPRAFTEEQIIELRNDIAAIGNKVEVVIIVPEHRPMLTENAELFAQQLEAAFRDAGWVVNINQSSGLNTKYGIHVVAIMKEKENTSSGAFFRLARAFIRAHIQFTNEFKEVPESANTSFALIQIEVGLTPLY
jgi:hypothetical protein